MARQTRVVSSEDKIGKLFCRHTSVWFSFQSSPAFLGVHPWLSVQELTREFPTLSSYLLIYVLFTYLIRTMCSTQKHIICTVHAMNTKNEIILTEDIAEHLLRISNETSNIKNQFLYQLALQLTGT